MTKSLTILGRRCIHSSSSTKSSPAQAWSRGFSISVRQSEDEQPKPISPRAQAQLNAALAIQDLARSRVSKAGSLRKPFSGPRSTSSSVQPGYNTTGIISPHIGASRTQESGSRYSQTLTGSDASGSTQVATRTLSRSSLSRGPLSGSNYPPSSRETRPSQVPIVRGGQSDGSDRSPSSRDTRPGRATTGRGRPLRRRGAVNNDGFDEDGDRTYRRKKHDEGITFSKEEKMALMKTLGHVEPFQIKPAQGPYLDMTSMMMEFAPKHFGATEPVSGQYPLLTDNNRRGLLQDIVRQVRKNETYTEKNIDQMAKKLGPAMPRA